MPSTVEHYESAVTDVVAEQEAEDAEARYRAHLSSHLSPHDQQLSPRLLRSKAAPDDYGVSAVLEMEPLETRIDYAHEREQASGGGYGAPAAVDNDDDDAEEAANNEEVLGSQRYFERELENESDCSDDLLPNSTGAELVASLYARTDLPKYFMLLRFSALYVPRTSNVFLRYAHPLLMLAFIMLPLIVNAVSPGRILLQVTGVSFFMIPPCIYVFGLWYFRKEHFRNVISSAYQMHPEYTSWYIRFIFIGSIVGTLISDLIGCVFFFVTNAYASYLSFSQFSVVKLLIFIVYLVEGLALQLVVCLVLAAFLLVCVLNVHLLNNYSKKLLERRVVDLPSMIARHDMLLQQVCSTCNMWQHLILALLVLGAAAIGSAVYLIFWSEIHCCEFIYAGYLSSLVVVLLVFVCYLSASVSEASSGVVGAASRLSPPSLDMIAFVMRVKNNPMTFSIYGIHITRQSAIQLLLIFVSLLAFVIQNKIR